MDQLEAQSRFYCIPRTDWNDSLLNLKSVGISISHTENRGKTFQPEQSCGEELSEPAPTFSHFYQGAKGMDCDEDETCWCVNSDPCQDS